MEWSITVWEASRLAYVAVPKAANTAVKAALLSSYVRKQKWRNPHAASMPYVEATKDDLRERYADYLTFTVVRDPFDRFVSFWADKIAANGWYESLRARGFSPGMGFEEAAVVAAALTDSDTDPHLRSQHDRLTHPDGTMAAQLLLRFEDLEQDWEALRRIAAHRADVPLAELEVRRQSTHVGPRHYFTRRAEQAVVERYAADFELLGYPTAIGEAVGAGGSSLHRLHRLVSGHRDAVVVDSAGPDAVRRSVVRAAGGVYLARTDAARPDGQVTSLTTAVGLLGDSAAVVVLHEGPADDEVATLSRHVRLLRLDC